MPNDFGGLFGLLCCLLTARPHDLVQLRACFAALDTYAAAHPGTCWPLTLIDADGTERRLATLEELLLRYSLDLAPLN